MKQPDNLKQTVRIIGGQYRGKKLYFPNKLGLRPTPSRVRETLFNWLMHHIHHASCLDAFAGSGALGFEAWSRGARHVTFIEASHPVFFNLKKQAASFNTPALHVIKSNALVSLNNPVTSNLKGPFDLIFLDPPFDKPEQLDKIIRLLEQNQMLSQNGLIYTESTQQITPNPVHWKTLKAKKAGLVHYALHQKI